MWCMKQIQEKKERRESGARRGDLKLYLRGEARSQPLQPFYFHLETCIPLIDSVEFLIFFIASAFNKIAFIYIQSK